MFPLKGNRCRICDMHFDSAINLHHHILDIHEINVPHKKGQTIKSTKNTFDKTKTLKRNLENSRSKHLNQMRAVANKEFFIFLLLSFTYGAPFSGKSHIFY